MKILITGGTGLIGRALVGELSAAGHRCTVLSRSRDVKGFGDSVGVEHWDAKSPDPLPDLMTGCDAVVHLAGEGIGEGRWTPDRKVRIRRSRVDSTAAIAAAFDALEDPPGIYLQASAVGFYGPRGDEEIDEETAPGDDFLARTCREWESASESIEARSVRRVLMRTGIVLTAQGGALPRMALPFSLFAGGKAGSGRQWMPWIHLADEVGAMLFLLTHDSAAGAFNLTAPQPATNAEFSQELGRALRRPSVMPAPAFALRLMLGEMATLVLDGQRAVPKRLLELGYSFRYPTLESALAEIYG